MNEYIICKLTELLIKQDFKDKDSGQVECISKVGAYKSLIKLFKEMKEYEKGNDNYIDAVDSSTYITSKNIY